MQVSISDQAHEIIDYINTLLNSTQHLDDIFRNKLEKVERKMDEFITNYHTHLALSISEFASYLNHDALSPLTVVIGYAELFRSVHAHMLTLDEINLLNEICDKLRLLTDSIRKEYKSIITKRNEPFSI